MSARTRVRSARSADTGSSASCHTGARPRTSPFGPATIDPPGNIFPPSFPVRFAKLTNTPCSSATSRIRRSHRAWLAGPGTSSSRGHAPRAGAADDTKITSAPSSAASVPLIECHASSHTSIAARPHGASNARMSCPRSTNRSSSNNPYVGRKFLRCTCQIAGSSGPTVTYMALL